MSDEQQRQHQQQQQQQQHQQQHTQHSSQHRKSPKDTQPQRKTNIHELRNQDYVSRLLAATPPYLYSAPVGPNNFFFSDMLRSLVQARNSENARNIQLQQSVMARRPRKRSWSHHRPYYDHLRERKELEEKQQQQVATSTLTAPNSTTTEKPLELTNKPFLPIAAKYSKLDGLNKELYLNSESRKLSNEMKIEEFEQNSTTAGGNADSSLQGTPPAASLPPQDLVLPPPPPVWYPPLYPPYGIDPLHFFIDLRVSGHIYDRKKENVSPLANSDNNNLSCDTDSLGSKHRHGSAFTVPVPRSNEIKAPPSSAINLSSSSSETKLGNYAKYYDLGEAKENHPSPKSNTNYVLQNLPRLYSQFAAKDLISNECLNSGNDNSNSYDNDNKSDPDGDCDSDGRRSTENYNTITRERDIDVEVIDSIKIRTDCDSQCDSGDEAIITHEID